MPMMGGTMEKMKFEEKEKMMEQMMPYMMANMTFQEKMKMMSKMMPEMMKDIDMNQMDKLMDNMMPMMMNMMEEKGINMFEMMRMMCPKCIAVATEKASEEEKENLKSQMTEAFANI